MKPLVCDIPYPTLDTIDTDVRSGQILSFAYATNNGEVTATLQYSFQHFVLDTYDKKIAYTLQQIALAEMTHVEILAKTMLRLGVTPTFTQYPNSRRYYDTSCVSQTTTLSKMLMDDLKSELNAIVEYKKIVAALQNDQVAAIVERIILDEQLHVETIKQLMSQLQKQ